MAGPVQKGTVANSNATSATSSTAWGSNLTVGNIVLVGISLSGSVNNPSPTVSSVNLGTDSLSLLTGAALSDGSGTSGLRVEIWGGTVVTSSQKTLTVNVSTAANIAVAGGEYAKATYTLTLDGSAQTNAGTAGGGGAYTGPAVTTSNANDLIFTVLGTSTGISTIGSPFTVEITAGGSGSGSGNAHTGDSTVGYADDTVSATGTYTPSWTTVATPHCVGVTVALKQVAAGSYLPYHRQRHVLRPIVRAKRQVRSRWMDERFAPAPLVSPALRHSQQKRRFAQVKRKRRVLNHWIEERQVTAPHADPGLPVETRHAQKRREPHVRPKRTVRSNLQLRIPQAPHPDLALPVGSRRAQKDRGPHVKAKRRVRSNLQLCIPQAPHADAVLPVLTHKGQRRRNPHVQPKRRVRSSIELRIPQAPHADAALPVETRWAQKKRTPRVKAKRLTRSNLQLRIPQAPHADLALPAAIRRGQKDRGARVRAKRIVRSNLQLRIPQAPHADAPLPVLIRKAQQRRLTRTRPKPAVRPSAGLRVPAPAVVPLPLRRRRLPNKQVQKAKTRRAARRSFPLRTRSVSHADLPRAIKWRGQARRIPRIHARRATRSSSIQLRIPPPSTTPAITARPIFVHKQARRIVCAQAKEPLRSNLTKLWLPQAPDAEFPVVIRRRGQTRRTPRVRSKRIVRSSVQLRIPQAPPVPPLPLPSEPTPLPGLVTIDRAALQAQIAAAIAASRVHLPLSLPHLRLTQPRNMTELTTQMNRLLGVIEQNLRNAAATRGTEPPPTWRVTQPRNNIELTTQTNRILAQIEAWLKKVTE